MTEIIVKPFEKGNEKIICEIHNEAFFYWINTLDSVFGYDEIKKRNVRQWLARDRSFILIAYDDDTPIGYVHCQLETITGEERELTNLVFVETKESLGQSKIAVLSTKRRKKVAYKLIAEALEIAKKKNVDTAMFFAYNDNLPIQKLMPKFGFEHNKLTFYNPYSTSKQFVNDSVLAKFDLKKELPTLELNQDVIIRKIRKDDLKDMIGIFGECRP
ncbi:MAG: GNAT family N-acetyltransferase, partial [Candidatus Heimdallarchaeota archaeon]